MTDYVAKRTGNRVRVKLSTGWTITHTYGWPLGFISTPGYRGNYGTLLISDYAATIESLATALVEWIRRRSADKHPNKCIGMSLGDPIFHEVHDLVATRTGDRVRVKLSTGWTITHTDGLPIADISHPGYRRVTGAVPAPIPATVESLAAALVKFIRAGAEPRPISRRHPRPGEGNHTWGIPRGDPL